MTFSGFSDGLREIGTALVRVQVHQFDVVGVTQNDFGQKAVEGKLTQSYTSVQAHNGTYNIAVFRYVLLNGFAVGFGFKYVKNITKEWIWLRSWNMAQ